MEGVGLPIESNLVGSPQIVLINSKFDVERVQGRLNIRPAIRGNEDIDIDVEGRSRLAVIANGYRAANGVGNLPLLKETMNRGDLVREGDATT